MVTVVFSSPTTNLASLFPLLNLAIWKNEHLHLLRPTNPPVEVGLMKNTRKLSIYFFCLMIRSSMVSLLILWCVQNIRPKKLVSRLLDFLSKYLFSGTLSEL